MWLYTKFGFFSVVQTKEDDKMVAVRARDKQDLLNLIEFIQGNFIFEENLDLGPEDDPNHMILDTKGRSDYPYRIFLEKEHLSILMSNLAWEVDYTNFKNEIAMQDVKRAKIYSKVWFENLKIEDNEVA